MGIKVIVKAFFVFSYQLILISVALQINGFYPSTGILAVKYLQKSWLFLSIHQISDVRINPITQL